jgi:hypothetical protein
MGYLKHEQLGQPLQAAFVDALIYVRCRTMAGIRQREKASVDALAREHPGHLLTVAMHDQPATVATYMQQRGFTFPVAIGTDAVESAFAVPCYLFKVLVAPDGRMLSVPNESWRAESPSVHRAVRSFPRPSCGVQVSRADSVPLVRST